MLAPPGSHEFEARLASLAEPDHAQMQGPEQPVALATDSGDSTMLTPPGSRDFEARLASLASP